MFNFLKKKCVVYMSFVLILFFLSLPIFAAPPTFDWLKISLNTANGVYIDANDTVVFTLKALNESSNSDLQIIFMEILNGISSNEEQIKFLLRAKQTTNKGKK